MATDHTHELGFVGAFVVPAERRRMLALLDSKPGRARWLKLLPHDMVLDAKLCTAVPHALQDAGSVLARLRGANPGRECTIISDGGLDGRRLPLRDALALVVGTHDGTIVSVVPGRIAYYEGEASDDAYVCMR